MSESFDLQEQRNITAELNKQLEALKDAKAVYSTIADFASNVQEELKAVTDELEDMSPGVRDVNMELNRIVTSVLAASSKLVQNYQHLGTDLFDQVSLQEKLAELENIKNSVFEDYFGKNNAMKDLLLERISIIEDEISAVHDLAEQQEVMNDQVNATADQIMGMFDNLQRGIEGLPGGGILMSMFGFDKFRAKFRAGVVDGLKEGALQISQLSTKMKVALGVIAVLVALAVDRFLAIDKIMRQIRDQTGLIGDGLERATLLTRSLNRGMARFGLDLEGSAAVVTALIDEFGSMDLVTREIAQTTARIHKALGLSVEEAAKITRIFDTLSGLSGNTADNLLASTIQLAEAANVAPQRVLSDIAVTGEKIFTVMSGTAEEIARAAVYARQLGSSLDTMTTVAEGLLDFESSIEKTMNASFLIGRSLNFEQARYNALIGKTQDAMSNILDEIGGISAFQNMLPFEQRALAEAIGVSADELIKMVRNQERLGELASGTLTAYEQFQKGATLSEVLQAEKVMTPLEEVANVFKSLIVSLSEVLAPILEIIIIPALRGLADILTVVGWVLNVIVDLFTDWEGLTFRLKEAWNLFEPIFEGIGNVIEWIIDGVQYLIEKIEGVIGFAGKLGSIFGFGGIQPAPAAIGGNVSTESAAVVRAASRSLSTTPGSVTGGSDMSGVEKKMDQLIDVVGRSKPITMDGKKVGEAVATSTPSL